MSEFTTVRAQYIPFRYPSHKWLAGMTAKATGLILDKDSAQSHDALDAIPVSGKKTSINRYRR
jgi:hypothetical protein